MSKLFVIWIISFTFASTTSYELENLFVQKYFVIYTPSGMSSFFFFDMSSSVLLSVQCHTQIFTVSVYDIWILFMLTGYIGLFSLHGQI